MLFAVAFALRAGFGLARGVEGENPRGNFVYLDMADGLLDGRGLGWQASVDGGWRWAHRTPLYPLFLAGLRGTLGRGPVPIVLAQALVGAASVWLAHRFARRLFPPGVALLAAAGVALYPYFVANDAAVGEQPLLTAATLAALLLADRARVEATVGRWAAVGALLGVGVMLRASMLPAALLAVAAVAVRPSACGGAAFRRRLSFAAAALAAGCLVCLPWAVRNVARVGRFALVTDSGRSLWIAQNDHTFDAYPDVSIDESERLAWADLAPDVKARVVAARGDETAMDAVYREEALRWMRAHPEELPGSAARKVVALFDARFSPPARDPFKEWAYRLSYGPAILLALLGAHRLRTRRGVLSVWAALILGAVVTSAVYWAQTRLRVHLDTVLLVLAAAGAAVLPGVRTLVARWEASLAVVPAGNGRA